MCKHFVMYQNGISSSLIFESVGAVAAGGAMRLPCFLILLFSHRSFSSTVSVMI